MGWFVSEEREWVELACLCPGTPHESDKVWLRSEIGPEGGFAALRAIKSAPSVDHLQENLGRVYAEFGIVEWTFVDESGEPVPCTFQNIARLSWAVLYPIATKADLLYAKELIGPLGLTPSPSSPGGRKGASTSARKASTPPRRKRSRPSTTAITQLHPRRSASSAGGSSSSPKKNSASA